MVEIDEIPIQAKMKDKFMKFFEFTNTDQGDWSIEGIISSEELKVHDNQYHGVSDSCSVCLHGLMQIVVFKNKKTHEMKGFGIVCGSNLIAMQKYDGDLNKLNYDRIVKLERKTITKRMLEFQAESGRIVLETQYFEEITWLYEFVEEVKIRYEEDYFNNTDPKFNNVFSTIRFFMSIYNQLQRKGKLSEKQIQSIRKDMGNEDAIFDRIDAELKNLWLKIAKDSKISTYHSIIMELNKPYKHNLNQWQRKVVIDLYDWYQKNHYYSPKQMGLIYKIASQVDQVFVDNIDEKVEMWDDFLQEKGYMGNGVV